MIQMPIDVTKETEAAQMPDPDDDLSIWELVLKYQLQFTKHFGPKYAFGVTNVEYKQQKDNELIVATARVRSVHRPTKGDTCQFDVPYGKFLVWRKNVKLYDFISAK